MAVFHKDFEELRQGMVARIAQRDADQSWDSPQQRESAEMIVSALWVLANNREISKVVLEFMREHLEKM